MGNSSCRRPKGSKSLASIFLIPNLKSVVLKSTLEQNLRDMTDDQRSTDVEVDHWQRLIYETTVRLQEARKDAYELTTRNNSTTVKK